MTPNEQLATELAPEGETRIALTNLINTLDPNNTDHPVPSHKKRRLLFPTLLVLAISSFCIFFFSLITTSTTARSIFQFDVFSNQILTLPQAKHLTPEETFYVYGNQNITDPKEHAYDLHLNHPSDPGLYESYLEHLDTITPEQVKIGETIDPGNSIYKLLRAARMASVNYDRSVLVKRDRTTGHPGRSSYSIKDTIKHQEIMNLLKQAKSYPKTYSPQLKTLRKRQLFLKDPKNFEEQYTHTIPIAISVGRGAIYTQDLANSLKAEIQQSIANKDIETFTEFHDIAQWLIDSLLWENSGLLITPLINSRVYQSILTELKHGIEELNIQQDFPHIQNQEALAIKLVQDSNRRHRRSSPSFLNMEKSGDITTSSSTGYLNFIPGITPFSSKDFKPGRYAERFYIYKMLFGILSFLLLIITPLIYTRVHISGKSLKIFSAFLKSHLQLIDWLWILLPSLIIPVIYFIIVGWLTPLAGRDLSIKYSEFIPVIALFVTTLLISFTSISCLTAWRLRVRFPQFIAPRSPFLFWPVILSILIAPIATLPFIHDITLENIEYIALSIATLILIWLLVPTSWPPSISYRVRSITIARIFIPALVVISLACSCIFVPSLNAFERHWVQQNPMNKMPTKTYALTILEERVAQAIWERLKEIADAG